LVAGKLKNCQLKLQYLALVLGILESTALL